VDFSTLFFQTDSAIVGFLDQCIWKDTGKTLDYCRGTPRESPAALQHYPAASPAENLCTKKKRPKPLSYFFGLLIGFVPWDNP
jgi:hypothetical protein